MSSVDQRVVQMEFDNSRFESNVKTTMSTLDRLKEKLHFGGEKDTLRELEQAGNSFNMDHMAHAIDTIANRFTLMGSIAFNAMDQIAQKAVQVGKQIVSSLTVEMPKAGMVKYEQETNSVQAIYNSVKNKGKSLQDVYDGLQRLAEYSDETSYSYTQMVDGASKFIANGVDMDVAVSAMMGISNAAAYAGVGINDASAAYKNFADAMSKGYFLQKDWISIQGIHMDTEQLRQDVIDTARALGKLDEAGRVIDRTTGKAKDVLTTENFVDMLRYGFFDKDVIQQLFGGKYADFDFDRVRKGADAFETIGDEMAAAAQQAKTFTDVIDSVKDAGSTGWKTTWRLIFGDLNEAINFFTPMANSLIEVVNAIDEYRNDMLQSWRDSGGREAMIEGLRVLWENAKKVTAVFEEGFGSVFRVTFGADAKTAGERLAEFTKRIAEAGKTFTDWFEGDTADGTQRAYAFYNIAKGVSAGIDIVRQAFSGIGTFLSNITAQLSPTFDKILVLFSDIGDGIYRFWGRLTDSGYFQDLANRISKWFEPITSRLPGVVDRIRKFGESVGEFLKTNPVMVRLTTSFKNLFNSIIDNVPKAIEGMIQFGKNIINTVKNSEEWKRIKLNYNTHLKPIISGIGEFAGRAIQGLADFFNFDSSKINGGWWEKLKARFSSTLGTIGPWVSEQWDKLKTKYPIVQKISDWWDTSSIGKAMRNFASSFGDSIDKFFGVDTSGETSIFGKIKARFTAFWNSFGPWLSDSWNKLKEKYPIVKNIAEWFSGAWSSVANWFENSNFISGIKEFFNTILGADTSGAENVFERIGIRVSAGWNYLRSKLNEVWNGIKEKHPFISNIANWFGGISSGIQNWWNTSNIASGIKEFGRKIWSSLGAFFEVDTSGISGTIDKLKARFSALWGDFGPWISEQWERIKSKFPSLESISKFISGLFPGAAAEDAASETETGTAISDKLKTGVTVFDKLKSFWESVKQFFAGIDFGSVAKYTALALSIYKTIRVIKLISDVLKTGESFRSTLGKFGGLIGNTNSLITDLRDKINGKQTQADKFKSYADGILKIAGSLAVVTGAIILLGNMDSAAFQQGVITIGAITVGLLVIQKLFGKVNDESGDKFGKSILGIGAGILAISTAIAFMGILPESVFSRGAAIVGYMLAILMLISKFLSGANIDIKPLTFVGIAGAIMMLALPITALGALSAIAGGGWLWTGFAMVSAILLELAVVAKVMNSVDMSGVKASGFIAIAVAIDLLALPVIALGAFSAIANGSLMWTGVAAVSALIAALGIVIKALNNVDIHIGKAIAIIMSIIPFIAILAVFLGACLILKDVPTETIYAMAASTAVVAAAVAALEWAATKIGNSKFSTVVKGIVAELGAAIIFIGALAAFCAGLLIVKDVPTDAMYSLAASMVIVAVAIGILEGVATKVGNSKFSSVVKGVVAELGAAVTFIAALAAFCVGVNMVKDVDPATMIIFAASGMIVSLAIASLAAVASFVGKLGIAAVLSGAVAELAAALTFAVEMAAFCVGAMMVKDIDPQVITTFAASSVIVSAAISILAAVAGAVGKLGIVSILSGAVAELAAALVLAGAMALFCIGVQQVKDIDAETMLAFAASCVGVSVALGALGLVVAAMGAIPIALVAKGVAALAIVAIGVSLIVSIAAALIGAAIEGFAANMTSVAGGLTIFNDLCGGLDQGAITSTVELLKTMADAFVEIGSKNYGDLDTFITDLTRIGASTLLFSSMSAGFDGEKAKTLAKDLADMAESLSGMKEVEDVSTTITHIGSAIKLYAESVNGATFENVPSSTQISAALEAIAGMTLPDMSKVEKIAEYGTEENASKLDEMALGIVAIGTAMSTFSNDMATVDFTNVTTGISNLNKFSDLNTAVSTVEVKEIGLFGTRIKTSKAGLTNFATDIVTLGAALKNFGTALGEEGLSTNIDTGISALESFSKIQSSLEPLGGVLSWFKGRKDLSVLSNKLPGLGTGLADFGNKIADMKATPDQVTTAVSVLQGLADIYKVVPKFGGIASWFEGENDISVFATKLPSLGEGLLGFAQVFQGQELNLPSNMDDVLAPITTIGELATQLESVYSDAAAGIDGSGVTVQTTKMQKIIELMEDVAFVATKIGDINSYLNTVVEDGVFGPNLEGMTDFVTWSVGVLEDINAIEAPNGGTFRNLQWLGDSVLGAFDSLEKASQKAEDGSFSHIIDPIKTGIEEILGLIEQPEGTETIDLSEFVDKLFASIEASFAENSERIENAGGTIADQIVSAITTKTETIDMSKTASGFIDAFNADLIEQANAASYDTVAEAITSSLSLSFGEYSADFETSGKEIVGYISNGISKDSKSVESATKTVVGWIISKISSENTDRINKTGKSITYAIASGLQTDTGIVKTATQRVVSWVVSALTDSHEKNMVPAGKALSTAIGNGILANVEAVRSAAQSVCISTANTVAGSVGSSFAAVGRNIDLGIASGIRNNVGSVTDAITAVINRTKAAAEQAGKIQSPSKVFAEIGRWIDLGMAKGIIDNSYAVSDSGVFMANVLENSVRDATQVHSPSPLYTGIGLDTVLSVAQGVKKGKVKLEDASEETSDAAAEALRNGLATRFGMTADEFREYYSDLGKEDGDAYGTAFNQSVIDKTKNTKAFIGLDLSSGKLSPANIDALKKYFKVKDDDKDKDKPKSGGGGGKSGSGKGKESPSSGAEGTSPPSSQQRASSVSLATIRMTGALLTEAMKKAPDILSRATIKMANGTATSVSSLVGTLSRATETSVSSIVGTLARSSASTVGSLVQSSASTVGSLVQASGSVVGTLVRTAQTTASSISTTATACSTLAESSQQATGTLRAYSSTLQQSASSISDSIEATSKASKKASKKNKSPGSADSPASSSSSSSSSTSPSSGSSAAGTLARAASTAGDSAQSASSGMATLSDSLYDVTLATSDLTALLQIMPELADKCTISYSRLSDQVAATLGTQILPDNPEAEELMRQMLTLYGLNPDDFELRPVITTASELTGSASGTGVGTGTDTGTTQGDSAASGTGTESPATSGDTATLSDNIVNAIKACQDTFSPVVNTENYKSIIKSIETVQEKLASTNENIDKLGREIRNMKIVLDTGAVVGATSDKMDRALGRKVSYSSRSLASGDVLNL